MVKQRFVRFDNYLHQKLKDPYFRKLFLKSQQRMRAEIAKGKEKHDKNLRGK